MSPSFRTQPGVSIVAALVLLIAAGCGRPAAGTQVPEPTPVRVARPALLESGSAVSAVGRLEAIDEARLGFVGAGVLRRVNVDIGDRFRAGAVLAELDTTALDASLRQVQEQAALARRDLARVEPLAARQLIARQQLDDARTSVQVADAAVRSAGFQRRYGQVVASADGIVMSRLAQPGEVLGAGQPVLAVSSSTLGWRMKVEVADRDATRLTPGLEASARFDGYPKQTFTARIREIGGRAAAGSGAITVDLDLDGGTHALRSGLIGRVSIPLPGSPTLSIPVSALVSAQGDQGQVLLARGGKAVAATVTLGELRGDRVDVIDGLSPQDDVIVEGAAWADVGGPVALLAAR